MKPGLAILPLEVWADVSEHPLLTRQLLAQIADNNGDWNFTEKMQKLLHGCGKHSLRYLDITSKQSDKTTQESEIEPECRALLAVAPDFDGWRSYVRDGLPTSKECKFPEIEIPEKIKTFKGLSIRYLDDEVLAFLNKIKPLFNNVYLGIHSTQSAPNAMQILLTQLLPMVVGIRGIYCDNDGMEFLEQHFPGTLALATMELDLFNTKPAFIPTCLDWLSAPRDFEQNGPKFLRAYAAATTIFAIVDAVRKQFLAATNQSAFVIFLQFFPRQSHLRAYENTFENAATNEEMTVRNAIFEMPNGEIIHYVEVLRHPIGAEAKMRKWVNERAYFERRYSNEDSNKEIRIDKPTIGRITNNKNNTHAVDQVEDKQAGGDEHQAGPSTSK